MSRFLVVQIGGAAVGQPGAIFAPVPGSGPAESRGALSGVASGQTFRETAEREILSAAMDADGRARAECGLASASLACFVARQVPADCISVRS